MNVTVPVILTPRFIMTKFIITTLVSKSVPLQITLSIPKRLRVEMKQKNVLKYRPIQNQTS